MEQWNASLDHGSYFGRETSMHLKRHNPRSFAALLCCFLLLMGVGLSACGGTTGSPPTPTAAPKKKVVVAYAGSLVNLMEKKIDERACIRDNDFLFRRCRWGWGAASGTATGRKSDAHQEQKTTQESSEASRVVTLEMHRCLPPEIRTMIQGRIPLLHCSIT